MPAQTRSRAGAGTMEDSTTGAGAEGKPRKRALRPKLSAMLPFVLGCLAPVPIYMAAMDKVPGEKAPKYPVLYEFNKLFKLCGVLFPVMLVAMRMAIKRLLGAATPLPASDLFSIGTCGVVSALRAVIYAATLHVRAADEEHKEVMSDHVFLAISIICLARFELYCCLETFSSNKLLGIPAALALAVVCLTHCNNYVTARFFHTTEESVMSLVCGALVFEIPASIFFYLVRNR